MSEPLWARDPDAALAKQREADDWFDTYGAGCCSVLTLLGTLVTVVFTVLGIVYLFF